MATYYWVNGSGKWSQPTYTSDVFTGTASTALASHTATLGGTWAKNTASSGSMVLDGSGRVYCNNSTNTETVYYLPTQAGTKDYTINADITCLGNSSTTEIGFVARMTTTNALNYYLLQASNNNINMFKCVNGTYTQLGSNYAFTPTVGTPFNLKFIVSGTSLKAVLNGTVVISVTDSTYTAAGYAGLRASEGSTSTTGMHLTNFAVRNQNWATSSGGVAGTTAPGSTDDVIMDYNSWTGVTGTITFDTNVSINTLNVDPFIYGGSATPFNLDFGTSSILVTLNGVSSGNVLMLGRQVTTLGSQNFNVIINGYGTWESLSSNTRYGSVTINCPGQTVTQSAGENAPSGGYYSATYTIDSLTLTAGTLVLAGPPFSKDGNSAAAQTWQYFNSNNTNTRTLDFNTATSSWTRVINITNLWNVGGTGFTMLNNQYTTINFANELRMYDSTTGTAGFDLTTHTGEENATWAKYGTYTGSFVFTDSNRIRANSTASALYYDSSNPPYFNDGIMQADFYYASNDGTHIGILGRFSTSTESGYLLQYNAGSTQWELYAALNGTYTLLASHTQSLAIGSTYTAQLVLSGTTISANVNDTTIMSVTDSSVTGAGTVAVRISTITTTPTNTKGIHLTDLIATPNNSVVMLLGQAGTAANDASYGIVAWTNPNNAKLADNTYATVSF